MHRPQSKPASRWISTSLLLLLSSLGALIVCEAGLRLFHPKYEDVSRYGKYPAYESRLWARPPNTSRYKAHPDTGVRHPVIYNEFGSRQHRRFDVDALKQAENVAFFGDSFAENSGIEAQYSFTEILDFLLNLQDDRDFNVLNFGIDGYGPGQEFVWYQQFSHRDDLDHVLYVFCDNDIENFHNHRLFALDDSGNLVSNVAVGRGPLVTALSRLHLTHLVLDFGLGLPWLRSVVSPLSQRRTHERLEPIHELAKRTRLRQQGDASSGDAIDDSIEAFQALLSHWKEVVEAHGGTFRVVVLPYLTRQSVRGLFPMQLDVVYLIECFNDMIPHFNYYAGWSFRSADTHWNEAGNMVAAHCLYRLLEEEMGAGSLSEATLASARHEYYSAVGVNGWRPPPAWAAPATEGTMDGARIAAKYMELDHRHRVLEELDDSTPIAVSDWAVYLLPERPSRRAVLAYVKTPCEEGQEDPFFLHVTPRNPRRLSSERAADGFDNLDFFFTDAWLVTSPRSASDVSKEGWTLNDRCVFGTELPRYEVARIRTGQYTGESEIWEVEIALDETGARQL